MNKNLVEGVHGHGAKVRSKLRHKIDRFLRPTIGKAEIPFDWTLGAGIQKRIGSPLKIKNQGSSSSCGGQAGSRLKEILRIINDNIHEELSARSEYAPGFAPGGGMTDAALINKICNVGENSEAGVSSYDAFGNSLLESNYEDLSWRTSATIQDALTRAGYIPVTVAIDVDSIAAAVRDYYAVILTIQGQNNGTWLGVSPVAPKDRANLWAHYVCSYDVPSTTETYGNKIIRFYNSWGSAVGNQGIQDLTEEYIRSGYVVDCFAVVKKFTPKQIGILEQIVVLLKQLVGQTA